MGMNARWVKGERFERNARFRVAAPAAKVFPLLCPVREYEWIPDWRCVMIYSESGVAEKDALFTTVEKPFGKMLWTCVEYDPPSRIDYLLTLGSKVSIRLELALSGEGGACELSWTMRFTVASRLLAALLRRRMSERAFAKMVGDRERQLAEYFSSGGGSALTGR